MPSPAPGAVAPPDRALGAAVAVAGVVVATAAVEVLKTWAPPLSLGVLYVLPVLLVATRWGVWLAVGTAVLSMVAFNFFALEPLYTLAIADSRHWAAVAVLLVTAVVTARIAEAGRREAARARAARDEADLVADLARTVLAADGLRAGLDAAGDRLSRATGVPVTVALADEPAAGLKTIPLEGPDDAVGALRHPPGLGADGRELLRRIAPALAALVRTAVERRRLAEEALATEALRRSDEVKTTILRATSHDLRTPLTQIATGAAALRSPSLRPDERDELAADIEQGSDRLSAMIDKLLDLSRLDAGAAHPRAELVALDDLVLDAVDGLGAAPGRVRVDVEEPPPVAWADPVHVTRIVGNLLENALVHGAEEPVLVRVVRRRERAVVRVVSAGGGIPRERLERIFDPFERGDAPAGTGSGLGLTIARGFAQANGGALYAESYPGQGAAFVLELPSAAPGGADGAVAPAGAAGGRDAEDGATGPAAGGRGRDAVAARHGDGGVTAEARP